MPSESKEISITTVSSVTVWRIAIDDGKLSTHHDCGRSVPDLDPDLFDDVVRDGADDTALPDEIFALINSDEQED